jgi:hypothetical protein
VANGGKFKLYTVLNGLIFPTPGFHLNARYLLIHNKKKKNVQRSDPLKSSTELSFIQSVCFVFFSMQISVFNPLVFETFSYFISIPALKG